MAYQDITFTAFEQPDVNKWNQLGENDRKLKTGEAIDDNAIVERHLNGRYASFAFTGYGKDARVGDGILSFRVPAFMNGMNLVSAEVTCVTAGTGSSMLVQVHNMTDGVDMLSTRLMVDAGEYSSATASTPYVINTSNDEVSTNDLIRIDVDQVHTTPAKTCHIILKFELP